MTFAVILNAVYKVRSSLNGKVNTVVIYVTMMLLILLPDINVIYANILIGLCGVIMIIAHILYFHLYFGILRKKAKCTSGAIKS